MDQDRVLRHRVETGRKVSNALCLGAEEESLASPSNERIRKRYFGVTKRNPLKKHQIQQDPDGDFPSGSRAN